LERPNEQENNRRDIRWRTGIGIPDGIGLSATKTTQGDHGVTCQRALTVANNIAIDISTCRPNRSASQPDSAVNIAHQIAAKVPTLMGRR
jgi:PknH-like extracellular domain